MKILPYKKQVAEFKPWSEVYLMVAAKLAEFIQSDNLEVLHFGSTAAKIGGKGIIDLSLLYNQGNLADAVLRLQELGFQQQNSENPFPSERPRKDGAIEFDGEIYQIHVHVIAKGSLEHHSQIAFKQHMLTNTAARIEYEKVKLKILQNGNNQQEIYGKLKSPFVKSMLNNLL